MNIYPLDKIKLALHGIDLIPLIEEGFVAYSEGRSVVPPVGELIFKDPPGNVHIKYGYICDNEYYCIKIASAFYHNENLDISGCNGMMLLFKQKTGESVCVLNDEGYLTDIRTAIAGAISAKYLAPEKVASIGVIGTGRQARMQVEYLRGIVDCNNLCVWGRTPDNVAVYEEYMSSKGYDVDICDSPSDVANHSNLLITATASTEPLLSKDDILIGTHITAMGSDTYHKRELGVDCLSRAGIVVADSIPQSRDRGEISWALRERSIEEGEIVELGNIISGQSPGRISEDQISLADLTGVAVQDIQIATAVYKLLSV